MNSFAIRTPWPHLKACRGLQWLSFPRSCCFFFSMAEVNWDRVRVSKDLVGRRPRGRSDKRYHGDMPEQTWSLDFLHEEDFRCEYNVRQADLLRKREQLHGDVQPVRERVVGPHVDEHPAS